MIRQLCECGWASRPDARRARECPLCGRPLKIYRITFSGAQELLPRLNRATIEIIGPFTRAEAGEIERLDGAARRGGKDGVSARAAADARSESRTRIRPSRSSRPGARGCDHE